MTFGENLRRIREKRGWTQTKLADRSGVLQPSISRYESGDFTPNIKALECLSKALKVTATQLLGF